MAKDLKEETVPRLIAALRDVGLYRFAAAVTEAAVRHLGLPPEKCPFEEHDAALADALFADFMASGNFGHGNNDFRGSAIVTLHRQEGKGSLATALSNIKEKCQNEWQITEKHTWLLLFFVPFWILRRLLKAPVRPIAMLRSAGERGKLYDSLGLFEEEQE